MIGYAGANESMLVSGRVDLAVGAAPVTHPDLYSRVVGPRLGWSVLVGPAHPAYEKPITRRGWLRSRHVQLSPEGSERSEGFVERYLEEAGATRTLAARIGYVVGVGELVAASDLVATLPTPCARSLAASFGLRCWAHPLTKLPDLAVRMSWHATQQKDADQAWFRAQVEAALGGPSKD